VVLQVHATSAVCYSRASTVNEMKVKLICKKISAYQRSWAGGPRRTTGCWERRSQERAPWAAGGTPQGVAAYSLCVEGLRAGAGCVTKLPLEASSDAAVWFRFFAGSNTPGAVSSVRWWKHPALNSCRQACQTHGKLKTVESYLHVRLAEALGMGWGSKALPASR